MESKFLYAIILGVILFGVIGCTGTGPAGPAASPTTTATAPATGTPKPGSVQAVDFNELMKFLPKAPNGYAAGTPNGGRVTTADGSYSFATIEYSKINVNDASVTIMDSAYYNVGMFTAWKSFMSYETSEGYVKTETVGKYPAWKTWSKKDSEYGLYVALNDRFMVFIHAYEEAALNDLRKAMELEFDKIAALR